MKKRVVSLLLALLLVLGLVPGAAAIETGADWDPDVEVDPGMGVTPIGMPEGEGTEDDPLRIENAEQLAWFAQTISDPEQGAQEVCAALTADIDLEDEPWEPMGRDTVADGLFCREIDGLFCRSSPDIIVRRRCVLSHKRRGWLQPSPSFRYSRNLALQDELYHPVINNGPAVLVCVDKRLGTGPVNQSRDAG